MARRKEQIGDDILAHAIRTETTTSINHYLGVPEEWPIVEKLQHGLVLMPNAADLKGAVRHNPKACALHNAAVRTLNIPNAAIGAKFAYIVMRDHRGRPYIARLQATAATAAAIRAFNKTGTMPEGGFVFIPVYKTHRLEYLRKYSKAYVRNDPSRRYQHTENARKRRAAKRRQPERKIPCTFYEEDRG